MDTKRTLTGRMARPGDVTRREWLAVGGVFAALLLLAAVAPSGDAASNVVLGLVVLAAMIAVYIAPYIVAVRRGAANQNAIGAVNVLTGWTFFGWVAALVWAMVDTPHSVSQSRG